MVAMVVHSWCTTMVWKIVSSATLSQYLHVCTWMMGHNGWKHCTIGTIVSMIMVAHSWCITIIWKTVSATMSRWLLRLHIYHISQLLDNLYHRQHFPNGCYGCTFMVYHYGWKHYHWHHCLKKITVLTLLVLRSTYSSWLGEHQGCWWPGPLCHQVSSSNGISNVRKTGLCLQWGRIQLSAPSQHVKDQNGCTRRQRLGLLDHT